MKKIIRRFLLSLSSFSPGIIIWLFSITNDILIILGAVIIVICYAIMLQRFFNEKYDKVKVSSLQAIESNVIPTYLGLFVIMLGISDFSILKQVIIMILIFIIWLGMEKNYYFNIIWVFLGYNFYSIEDEKGTIVTVISKNKNIKQKKAFESLIRLNNFTFLDKE